jgi:hypothetical protein
MNAIHENRITQALGKWLRACAVVNGVLCLFLTVVTVILLWVTADDGRRQATPLRPQTASCAADNLRRGQAMNETTLVQFMDRVFDLLRQRGIAVERVDILIAVSNDYYERIKENFPNRPVWPVPDIAFGIDIKNKGPITIGRQLVMLPKRMPIEPREAQNAEEFLRQVACDVFNLAENEYQMEVVYFQVVITVSQSILEEERSKFEDITPESEEITVINDAYTVGIIDRRQHWSIGLTHLPDRSPN